MGKILEKPTLDKILNDLTDRIRRLEVAARLGYTSYKGTVTALDDQGRIRVQVGTLQDGTFGIQVFDSSGASTFKQSNA